MICSAAGSRTRMNVRKHGSAIRKNRNDLAVKGVTQASVRTSLSGECASAIL